MLNALGTNIIVRITLFVLTIQLHLVVLRMIVNDLFKEGILELSLTRSNSYLQLSAIISSIGILVELWSGNLGLFLTNIVKVLVLQALLGSISLVRIELEKMRQQVHSRRGDLRLKEDE